MLFLWGDRPPRLAFIVKGIFFMENFFSYLNVAIGVSFIYMILSLLISELQENLTALLEIRAISLRGSLINLLEGKDKYDNPEKAEIMLALYNTSLLKSLNQGRENSKGPSYIPKEIFSAALLEVLKTRYQLDINNQDNIDDIANKIDSKLQENQDNLAKQVEQTQLQEILVNNETSSSAWNDPNLEPSILPLDMMTTTSNIQSIPNLPDEQNINALVNVPSSISSTNNFPVEDLKKSDIYLLTNLSTLARRLQDQVEDKEVKLVEFQKGLAEWFDQSMVRASGAYKRNSKGISFCIGLIVAILGNIDTINMVDRLYKNQSLSGTVNQLANQVVENNSQSITTLNAANTLEEKNNAIQPIKDNINVVIDQIAAFPIGWTLPRDTNISAPAWISRLAGWFVSAIAFSMGAPFWFELLNKFINVRNTGQRPKTGQPDTPNSQT